MVGDCRLILARSHFQLKPIFLRTGYGWCAFWLGFYIGYENNSLPPIDPAKQPYGDGIL